jgi:hypothetical protein
LSRYKPNRTVRAPEWSAGEHATFIGSLSFMAAQRVAYHVGATQGVTPSTPEEVQTFVEHMTAALLETLDPSDWTVLGRDGQVVPLTMDGLGSLLVEDIAFLFGEAFPPDPSAVTANAGTPAETTVYQPNGLITPQAAEVGLHPGNFRIPDPTEVAIPG